MKTRLTFGLLGALGCLIAATALELIFAPLGVEQWFNEQGTRVLIFNNNLVRPSSPLHPKTGDIQLTLRWNHLNDLDLHCIDPTGQQIFYGRKRVESLGELDLDANAGRPPWVNQPIENIYWPFGSAPLGRYKVLVRHFRTNGGPNPVAFQCRILVHGRVTTVRGTSFYTRPPSHGPREPRDLDPHNTQPPTLIHEFDVHARPRGIFNLRAPSWLAALIVGLWTALLAGLLASFLVLGLNRWFLRHERRLLLRSRQERAVSLGSLRLGFLVGALTQLLFDLMTQEQIMPLDSTRALGWMLLAGLSGWGLSRAVPYLPRVAAGLAGVAGGMVAEYAFQEISAAGAGNPARMLGAAIIGFAIGITIHLVARRTEEPAETFTYDLPELQPLRCDYEEIGAHESLRPTTLDFRPRQKKR